MSDALAALASAIREPDRRDLGRRGQLRKFESQTSLAGDTVEDDLVNRGLIVDVGA